MTTSLGKYRYQPRVRKITPLEIIVEATTSYITEFLPMIPRSSLDPSFYMPKVIATLGNPPKLIEEILDKWWESTSFTVDVHSFICGPLSSLFGSPYCMLNYFSLSFRATSWRSLMTEYDSSEIDVKCISKSAILNMLVYDEKENDLKREIDSVTKTNIQTSQLDF
jgi:hypothetical protein